MLTRSRADRAAAVRTGASAPVFGIRVWVPELPALQADWLEATLGCRPGPIRHNDPGATATLRGDRRSVGYAGAAGAGIFSHQLQRHSHGRRHGDRLLSEGRRNVADLGDRTGQPVRRRHPERQRPADLQRNRDGLVNAAGPGATCTGATQVLGALSDPMKSSPSSAYTGLFGD